MIDLDRLIRLALGELDDAETASVEEHVLACGPCASKLERLLRIGHALRDVVQAGTVGFPATGALVQQLDAAGLVSRWYHLLPDQSVPCAVEADDVYALTTLEADLRGVEHVDAVSTMLGGATRMRDVPFDAERGVVHVLSRSDQLRMLPSVRIKLELFAVEASGERKLSEYYLDHTGFDA